MLTNNGVALPMTAKQYDPPIIFPTVKVGTGVKEDTRPRVASALKGVKPIDGTSINSRDDQDFSRGLRPGVAARVRDCWF